MKTYRTSLRSPRNANNFDNPLPS